MKQGWTYKKLGEVCEIFNGNSINADFKKKHFLGASSGLPFIATKDVATNGSIDYENGVRIPNYNEYKIAPANSVFVCAEGGSAGKKFAFVERDVCFGNKLFCLNPKETSLEGKFAYYFVQSDAFKVQFYALLTGLIGGVSAKKFQQIGIPLPSLSEQERIVSRLDAAFWEIEGLKAKAEKQLEEARILFQAELKESMKPKEGWEEKTLGDICKTITDGTHHSPVNTSEGRFKYITAKNIKTWGLDLSNITFVSEDVHKEIIARCCPEKGDVLYIKDGATTGIAIVNPLEEQFSLLSSVALLKPDKDKLSSAFLCYALNSPVIYVQTRNQMDGAAITRVTLVKIKSFVIPLPSLKSQQEIVSRLDALSANVKRLEELQQKTLKECDALKQAMLREVFE